MRSGDRSCQTSIAQSRSAPQGARPGSIGHSPAQTAGGAFSPTPPIRTPCGTDRGGFVVPFTTGLRPWLLNECRRLVAAEQTQ